MTTIFDKPLNSDVSSNTQAIANLAKTISSGSLHDIISSGLYYLTNAVTDKPTSTGGYYAVSTNGSVVSGIYVQNSTGSAFSVTYNGTSWTYQQLATKSDLANKGTPVYIGSKAGGQEFTLDWNTYDEYYCIAQYGNSTSLQSQCVEQYVRNILSDMGRANCVLCSGQGGIEAQLALTNQNKLLLSYFGVGGTAYTTTSYLYVWGIKK